MMFLKTRVRKEKLETNRKKCWKRKTKAEIALILVYCFVFLVQIAIRMETAESTMIIVQRCETSVPMESEHFSCSDSNSDGT